MNTRQIQQLRIEILRCKCLTDGLTEFNTIPFLVDRCKSVNESAQRMKAIIDGIIPEQDSLDKSN